MEKNIIFLFSGQGSQYYQMGAKLYKKDGFFRFWVDRANAYITKKYGLNVLEELYKVENKKTAIFNDIIYTHPAIFIIEYALSQLLINKHILPNYLLGGSLGEFTALVVADCIPFYEALELIVEQAFLIESVFPDAKMIAVFSPYYVFNNEPILNENSEIVSINFENHFVICFEEKAGKIITDYLESNDILYQEVTINKAFHSSLIDGFRPFLNNLFETRKLSFKTAEIPVISCVDGLIKNDINVEYLWNIIRCPIKFYQTIKKNEDTIVKESILIDLSPSGTYATFSRHCLKEVNKNVFHLITPFDDGERNLYKLFNWIDSLR